MEKTAEEIMIDNFEGYSFSSDLEPVIIQCMQEFASQSRWIDIYDSMPIVNQRCLVVLINGDVTLDVYTSFHGGNIGFIHNVKYWMPLPNVPKDNSGTAEPA